MTTKLPLKDQLFNRSSVLGIAVDIAAVDSTFPADRFVNAVTVRLAGLALKQRIAWISDCLRSHLVGDYREALAKLIASLPPPCDPTLSDGDFGNFIYGPYSHFMAAHGCSADHLDISLEALRAITTRFSAEDAIRPFINAFPERTFAVLQDWTHDPHYHVRRLCSEGTRPRLPWSSRLTTPLQATVPILDALYGDRTRFVTRSVANHLNDIAKDDPDLTVDLLDRWRASGRQTECEMDYIVRHSTRTLVKRGNPRTLRLVGVEPATGVDVTNLRCSAQVTVGDAIEFGFSVAAADPSAPPADVVIDYKISFPGSTGRIGSRIYKLRRARLADNGGSLAVHHRHRLRAGMTTRRIVAGRHQLTILVNGQSATSVDFNVTDGD